MSKVAKTRFGALLTRLGFTDHTYTYRLLSLITLIEVERDVELKL